MVGIVVVFYAVPAGAVDWGRPTLVALAGTLAGVVVLGWAIVGQVRRHLMDGSAHSVHSLFMLFGLVAVVFAFGYYLLDLARPDEVEGLSTRTDALYFTLSTLTTVGFGDVHAAGQIARGLVIIQMVFDVVFVAALGATLSGQLRSRVAAQTRPPSASD